MRYYIGRPYLTQAKNKAQAHIQEFIKKFFYMLVNSDEELNQLIARIEREVGEANSRYPRCKEIKMNVQRHEGADSVSVWIHADVDASFASLTAYKVCAVYDRGFVEYVDPAF
jgi:hypothetical protein